MIDPSVWGPLLWKTIHIVALAYPARPTPDDVLAYRAFFVALGDVIPCCKCRDNYKRHLQELPIDAGLAGRDDLFAWTVSLHNIVNAETGKPQFPTQDAQARFLAVLAASPSANETAPQVVGFTSAAATLTVVVGLVAFAVTALAIFAAVRARRCAQ